MNQESLRTDRADSVIDRSIVNRTVVTYSVSRAVIDRAGNRSIVDHDERVVSGRTPRANENGNENDGKENQGHHGHAILADWLLARIPIA